MYIEIDNDFFREEEMQYDLEIHNVPTKDQMVDIFTKGLSSLRLHHL